jgi:pimeloyl-ACP methyl ester carboxylesterase
MTSDEANSVRAASLTTFIMTIPRKTWVLLLLALAMAHAEHLWARSANPDPYLLYEKPTRIVAVSSGAKLAMYCVGHGSPTIVLETGAGGGTYEAWYKLQPLLAHNTRVCSYDRAGFGFSQLALDLPRDLNHDITDLHELLIASKEKGPFILVGHSMGGLLMGAYADKYAGSVAGLVLLESSILLSAEEVSNPESDGDPQERAVLERKLRKYRQCEALMEDARHMPRPTPQGECLDSMYFDSLSPAMAAVEIHHESNPDYWRALESELKNNWLGIDSRQAASWMPHRWRSIPVRVITTGVSTVSDAVLAPAIGVSISNKAALQRIRKNHERWEHRQGKACEFSTNCKMILIKTPNHLVQNAAPKTVAHVIKEVLEYVRTHNNLARD